MNDRERPTDIGELKHQLELQLIKIRGEANAARLEARAAEIEWVLRRLASASSPPPRFDSWDDVARAQRTATVDDRTWVRTDGPHRTVPAPRGRRESVDQIDADQSSESAIAIAPTEVDLVADAPVDTDSRRRPMAVLISAGLHLLLLIALAMMGLRVMPPKDQVALTASASPVSEISIETFEIESAEAPETSEIEDPTSVELDAELNPTGTIASTNFKPGVINRPPSGSGTIADRFGSIGQSMRTLAKNDQPTMEFCGVAGGGNHFVYLVDSSKSMRDGFHSARQQLLQSIDLLKPDQRFYVVFFDKTPSRMRISDPRVDEPKSVYATDENKTRLRRWAMGIQMDDGRNPFDMLQFAMTLKPDVIFLLSDGDFQGRSGPAIERLLKEDNHVTNLFGETRAVSIVHTIAYHNDEGEARMRRIARDNGGQFRYVPKP